MARSFYGGPETGAVPIRGGNSEKYEPKYDPSEPSHWVNPDGSIESGPGHIFMGNFDASYIENKDLSSARANLHGEDAITVEVGRDDLTPEQVQGIARLKKDTGVSRIWYYGPGMRDVEEFRSIGSLQRYIQEHSQGGKK